MSAIIMHQALQIAWDPTQNVISWDTYPGDVLDGRLATGEATWDVQKEAILAKGGRFLGLWLTLEKRGPLGKRNNVGHDGPPLLHTKSMARNISWHTSLKSAARPSWKATVMRRTADWWIVCDPLKLHAYSNPQTDRDLLIYHHFSKNLLVLSLWVATITVNVCKCKYNPPWTQDIT